MNTICFCSVIHSQVLPYLSDFLNSLKKQTFKEFDLLLFVDGIDDSKTKIAVEDLNVRLIKAIGTPLQIRTQLLTYLKESNYDLCIFGDADDYFAANRIAVCKEYLAKYDLVVNDVSLVRENGSLYDENFWKDRFTGNREFGILEITDANFAGLGNTAIRISALPKDCSFPDKMIAADWLLFSKMLLQGSKGLFTSETAVFYRQYEGNTIGLGTIDVQRIQKGITVKLFHYNALKEISANFERKRKALTAFEIKFKEKTFQEYYFDILKKELPENPFWWEEVKIIEEIQR